MRAAAALLLTGLVFFGTYRLGRWLVPRFSLQRPIRLLDDPVPSRSTWKAQGAWR